MNYKKVIFAPSKKKKYTNPSHKKTKTWRANGASIETLPPVKGLTWGCVCVERLAKFELFGQAVPTFAFDDPFAKNGKRYYRIVSSVNVIMVSFIIVTIV